MLVVKILSNLITRPGKIVKLKMVHKTPRLSITSLLFVGIESNSLQICTKTPAYVTIKVIALT